MRQMEHTITITSLICLHKKRREHWIWNHCVLFIIYYYQQEEGKRTGDGCLWSFPPEKLSFFIFSSHQRSCSLLILPILTTLVASLMSMAANKSWTPSHVCGQDFFLSPFVFFESSLAFTLFCKWFLTKIQTPKKHACTLCLKTLPFQ